EEILAGDVVGNVLFESLRHLRQPRRAFGLRLESQLWTGAIGDGAMHDRLYTRGQGFVALFTRKTGLRRKDAGCEEHEWRQACAGGGRGLRTHEQSDMRCAAACCRSIPVPAVPVRL